MTATTQKRLLLASALLFCCTLPALARGTLYGWAERGGYSAVSSMSGSTIGVQRGCPGAQITVLNSGTATASTIYSDSIGTAKSNPFTATTAALWQFYADDGDYDVVVACGTTFTYTLRSLRIGGESAASVVRLDRLATDGLGTASDPWTGWDSALVIGTAGVGTIAVSYSSGSLATVTGTSSAFLSSSTVGQWVCTVPTSSGVACGKISAIANDFSLTVEFWGGATISGASYRIYSPISIYAPTGYYTFSSAWQLGFPYLSLHGDGASTRFTHSGSAKGISIIGNYTGLGSGSNGLDISGFTVQGSATTTHALYIEGVNQVSASDIYVHSATTAGIALKDIVLATFTNVRYTGNQELPLLPKPTYGWHVEGVNSFAGYGCVSEVAGEGVYLVSSDNFKWTDGTIEGNDTIGLHLEALAQKTTIDNVDFEGNGTYDIFSEGARWFVQRNLQATGTTRLSSDTGIGAFSIDCSIIGGQYGAITLDAGAVGNTFIGFTYSDAGTGLTDNAGGGNTFILVKNRTTGLYYLGSPFISSGLLTTRNATANKPGLNTQSGFGGSPTIDIETGSSDSSITVVVTAGTAPSASGAIALDFVPALEAGKIYAVVGSLLDGTGAWEAAALGHFTVRTNTGFTYAWSNAAVSLVQGSTYKFQFILVGH